MRTSRRSLVGAAGVLQCLTLVNALDPIARFYGTDKASGYHWYTRHYARHLRNRRFKKNLVFEIGVGGRKGASSGGASLRPWRDSLVRSHIVGIDIEEKALPLLGRRVEVVRADQSDESQLTALVTAYGSPDIVIDDGSHVGD